jgi:histidyl-tRNA synthetase
MVEAEVLSAVSEVLTRLGFTDFVIRLNHRRVLASLLDAAGVPPAQHADALVSLDKLDKIGAEGVAAEFVGRGIGVDVASRCLAFFTSAGDTPDGILAQLHRIGGDPEGIANLAAIVRLSSVTPAAGRIKVDPSLARGLSYYTGAIMEIAVPELAGSLGGGGRYDNLIGAFLGREVPACGFSLGLERILVVMGERHMFPASVARGPVEAMVTLWNGDGEADALRLARELRAAGLRVEVYPEPDKLGKQFKYAASRQVPCITIVGDEERAAGQVAVKDLRTGAQQTVARGDAPVFIRTLLHG